VGEALAQLEEVLIAGADAPERGGEVEYRATLTARAVFAVAAVAVEAAVGIQLKTRVSLMVKGTENLAGSVGHEAREHANVLGGRDREQFTVE
jgi:hypothetical protein